MFGQMSVSRRNTQPEKIVEADVKTERQLILCLHQELERTSADSLMTMATIADVHTNVCYSRYSLKIPNFLHMKTKENLILT